MPGEGVVFRLASPAAALPYELLPLLVWLLITGWLTLWRRHSRVGPALLMHHPDVVLPAGPPVCSGSATWPGAVCPASRCRGACCAGGQLTDGYAPACLVRLECNKAGLLESKRGAHRVAKSQDGHNTPSDVWVLPILAHRLSPP